MSDEVLERFIQQYIAGVTGARGRVLVAGRRADAARPGVLPQGRRPPEEARQARPEIENDLQTNGTLIDEEWCEFLKEHRFLVGLSIDGPQKLHDRYRVAKDGQPTFDQVMAAVEAAEETWRAVQHADVRPPAQRQAPGGRVPLPARRGRLHVHAVHPHRRVQGFRADGAAQVERTIRCRATASPKRGPAIRTRSSPTGRWIPTIRATS